MPFLLCIHFNWTSVDILGATSSGTKVRTIVTKVKVAT